MCVILGQSGVLFFIYCCGEEKRQEKEKNKYSSLLKIEYHISVTGTANKCHFFQHKRI